MISSRPRTAVNSGWRKSYTPAFIDWRLILFW